LGFGNVHQQDKKIFGPGAQRERGYVYKTDSLQNINTFINRDKFELMRANY
jgi:hypothetical protein